MTFRSVLMALLVLFFLPSAYAGNSLSELIKVLRKNGRNVEATTIENGIYADAQLGTIGVIRGKPETIDLIPESVAKARVRGIFQSRIMGRITSFAGDQALIRIRYYAEGRLNSYPEISDTELNPLVSLSGLTDDQVATRISEFKAHIQSEIDLLQSQFPECIAGRTSLTNLLAKFDTLTPAYQRKFIQYVDLDRYVQGLISLKGVSVDSVLRNHFDQMVNAFHDFSNASSTAPVIATNELESIAQVDENFNAQLRSFLLPQGSYLIYSLSQSESESRIIEMVVLAGGLPVAAPVGAEHAIAYQLTSTQMGMISYTSLMGTPLIYSRFYQFGNRNIVPRRLLMGGSPISYPVHPVVFFPSDSVELSRNWNHPMGTVDPGKYSDFRLRKKIYLLCSDCPESSDQREITFQNASANTEKFISALQDHAYNGNLESLGDYALRVQDRFLNLGLTDEQILAGGFDLMQVLQTYLSMQVVPKPGELIVPDDLFSDSYFKNLVELDIELEKLTKSGKPAEEILNLLANEGYFKTSLKSIYAVSTDQLRDLFFGRNSSSVVVRVEGDVASSGFISNPVGSPTYFNVYGSNLQAFVRDMVLSDHIVMRDPQGKIYRQGFASDGSWFVLDKPARLDLMVVGSAKEGLTINADSFKKDFQFTLNLSDLTSYHALEIAERTTHQILIQGAGEEIWRRSGGANNSMAWVTSNGPLVSEQRNIFQGVLRQLGFSDRFAAVNYLDANSYATFDSGEMQCDLNGRIEQLRKGRPDYFAYTIKLPLAPETFAKVRKWISDHHLPFISALNDTVLTANPVSTDGGTLTLPDAFVRVITNPRLVAPMIELAREINRLITMSEMGVHPTVRLDELVYSHLQKAGYQGKELEDLFYDVMGTYATRGSSMVDYKDLIHPKMKPLFDAFSFIYDGAAYLDKFGSGTEYFSFPRSVKLPCAIGKAYHFWMSAYLYYELVQRGYSHQQAVFAVRFIGLDYELYSSTVGRNTVNGVNNASSQAGDYILDKPDFDSPENYYISLSLSLKALGPIYAQQRIKGKLRVISLADVLTAGVSEASTASQHFLNENRFSGPLRAVARHFNLRKKLGFSAINRAADAAAKKGDVVWQRDNLNSPWTQPMPIVPTVVVPPKPIIPPAPVAPAPPGTITPCNNALHPKLPDDEKK